MYLLYLESRFIIFFYKRHREKSTFLNINLSFAFLVQKRLSIRVPLGKILDRDFRIRGWISQMICMMIFLVLLVRIPSSHGGDGTQKNSPHIPGKKILV
jgi:hypothetical protein